MVGAMTDITERKQTEEALQLAKYTVEHATEAIYWVGSDAELLDVNDAATKHESCSVGAHHCRGVQCWRTAKRFACTKSYARPLGL